MLQITNVYSQVPPAVRFIGRRFYDEDRVDGGISQQWYKSGYIRVLS